MPSGLSRGSNTGPSTRGVEMSWDSRSSTNRTPSRLKQALVPAASTEYETMPTADSRARSLRARSAGGTSELSPMVSSLGQASRLSLPDSRSSCQRHMAGSSPSWDRRYRTLVPSAMTEMFLGVPMVNR